MQRLNMGNVALWAAFAVILGLWVAACVGWVGEPYLGTVP